MSGFNDLKPNEFSQEVLGLMKPKAPQGATFSGDFTPDHESRARYLLQKHPLPEGWSVHFGTPRIVQDKFNIDIPEELAKTIEPGMVDYKSKTLWINPGLLDGSLIGRFRFDDTFISEASHANGAVKSPEMFKKVRDEAKESAYFDEKTGKPTVERLTPQEEADPYGVSQFFNSDTFGTGFATQPAKKPVKDLALEALKKNGMIDQFKPGGWGN